jgi:hypothetical protein
MLTVENRGWAICFGGLGRGEGICGTISERLRRQTCSSIFIASPGFQRVFKLNNRGNVGIKARVHTIKIMESDCMVTSTWTDNLPSIRPAQPTSTMGVFVPVILSHIVNIFYWSMLIAVLCNETDISHQCYLAPNVGLLSQGCFSNSAAVGRRLGSKAMIGPMKSANARTSASGICGFMYLITLSTVAGERRGIRTRDPKSIQLKGMNHYG